MNTKPGNADLVTSPIVYGCMRGAGTCGTKEEGDTIAVLREAFDVGLSFCVSAEAYDEGQSEQLLGRARGDKRSEIVNTFQGGQGDPGALRTHCRLRAQFGTLGSELIGL